MSHRDERYIGCFTDCGHHEVAEVSRPSYPPIYRWQLRNAKAIAKADYTADGAPVKPLPVFTRRKSDNLGSCHPNGKCTMDFLTLKHDCHPETTEHKILRVTSQTHFLSTYGKKFRSQFQRFGYERSVLHRTYNVDVQGQSELTLKFL